MAYQSENCTRLKITTTTVTSRKALAEKAEGFNGVLLLRLPACAPKRHGEPLQDIGQTIAGAVKTLGKDATLITIGESVDLVAVQSVVSESARYQSWIAIKRTTPLTIDEACALPSHHFGALIHTRYQASLRHTKTRIAYTYCPACDKTTKDYGGKKHTYHQYGTLMSDVWRDVESDLSGDLTPIFERFADFFGIEQYKELRVIDCRQLRLKRQAVKATIPAMKAQTVNAAASLGSKLVTGDCLEELRKLPDNSVDFAFADPPYNLRKVYAGYSDDLAIAEYFDWCDQWLYELARVLKPGRTCAILNIPLWSIRHFLYLQTVLQFQNWIAWDGLSFPVRMLMPSHYAILCFSKGAARQLPGLQSQSESVEILGGLPFGVVPQQATDYLTPLDEGFCLRAQCVNARKAGAMNDRGRFTDLWWDIHRLKHNTRRVDHPCQLPPSLMYRLITAFTQPKEMVLDCFNGSGTTTLTAHQLDRGYYGIEREASYHQLALFRHKEITQGIDPFRKAERELTAKNSPVPRLLKQKYDVPKKTLQLEVKRVASKLKRLPTREDMIQHGQYPITYYDNYFISWGEVCAAARTTGMSETRTRASVVSSRQIGFIEFED